MIFIPNTPRRGNPKEEAHVLILERPANGPSFEISIIPLFIFFTARAHFPSHFLDKSRKSWSSLHRGEIHWSVDREASRMSGSGSKKVVEAAAKAAKSMIDWDGMAKLLISEEARKEFANLRRAFDEVNQDLQTKFSQVYSLLVSPPYRSDLRFCAPLIVRDS